MSTYQLDPQSKAELHSEAEKLMSLYESPIETVKALMAYNCELETQILAIAHRYPCLVTVNFDASHPTVG